MNDYSKDTDISDLKRSADQLNNNIKQQTLQIKNSIESQKTELKKLYDEQILFDQNKRNELHVSIISSQKTLIEDYKEKNYQLTLNLKNSEKRVLEIDRSFKSNNAELKNTLSRYIVNSKKIQEKLNLVEESKNLKLEKQAKNVKFYYNPVSGLFEPIPYDGHRFARNYNKNLKNYYHLYFRAP